MRPLSVFIQSQGLIHICYSPWRVISCSADKNIVPICQVIFNGDTITSPPVSSRVSVNTDHPHKGTSPTPTNRKDRGSFLRYFRIFSSLYVVVGKSYIHTCPQHHSEGCCRYVRIRLVKSMRTGISQSTSSVFKKRTIQCIQARKSRHHDTTGHTGQRNT